MPLEIESRPRRAPVRAPDGARAITVGLVNNMPDGALESTETQFTRLLRAAAGPDPVRLRFYSLPEVPRASAARAGLDARGYWPIDELNSAPPDALIITGMEPGGRPLPEEPYWARFVEVLEWADTHTVSSVCSCLAAHAAVLHFDNIQRQRLAQKLFGVFQHRVDPAHPFMAGIAPPLAQPHSRWNDLPVEALRRCGYSILSASEDTGADTFTRQRRSLFLCFQGHPEYEDVTLLKEFRRDVGRFLRGEHASYPLEPRDYFTPAGLTMLAKFRERALKERHAQLLTEFPTTAAAQALSAPWAGSAARIYGNWLKLVAAAARPEVSERRHCKTTAVHHSYE